MQTIKISLSRSFNVAKDVFIDKLFNYELMKSYQIPPLVSYELKQGELFKEGSLVYLYYDELKSKIIKEQIIKNNLPDNITIKQQYNDITVILKHSFKENIWHLDYQFIINNDNHVNKIGLAKQLTEDMESFLKIL